jgi:hypothetical protein
MSAFGIPAFAVYDSYFPWEPAQRYLAERADRFIPVHVGFAIGREKYSTHTLCFRDLSLFRAC